jgi:Meiotically up-regulated gene 113
MSAHLLREMDGGRCVVEKPKKWGFPWSCSHPPVQKNGTDRHGYPPIGTETPRISPRLFAACSWRCSMSIRRDSRSPYWQYDFQIKGRRYFGSTKTESEYEAQAIEREARLHAKHGLWDKLNPRKKHGPKAPVLYVIHAAGSTRFKLGISRDPKRRLGDLQVGSSVPLVLVSTTKVTSLDDERHAHRVLAQWRSRGEWFDLGVTSDSFLQEIRAARADVHELLAVLGAAQFAADLPPLAAADFARGLLALPS